MSIKVRLVGPIPSMKTIMDKRTIKSGTFLVVDMASGKAQVVRRYTGIEQRQRRDAFVRKNLALCRKCYSDRRGHWEHKREDGRRLVERARIKLGYSPTTGSQDIYRLLFISYLELGYHEPVPGCGCGYCKRP